MLDLWVILGVLYVLSIFVVAGVFIELKDDYCFDVRSYLGLMIVALFSPFFVAVLIGGKLVRE